MPEAQDLTGQRFGRLVVTGINPGYGRFSDPRRWAAVCDCGARINVRTGHLNTKTRSCGCLGRERTSLRSIKHGAHQTPEYRAWHGMRQRCENPKNRRYPHYGGRGIVVCSAWREGFSNFLADMGMRPSPDHSLDRKDNDGNYEPGNCRWATDLEQCHNRSNSVKLTHEGRTATLEEWARDTGISRPLLRKRLAAGWPAAKALYTPSMRPTKRGSMSR